MRWSSNRSILLTKLFILFFIAGYLAAVVFAPYLVEHYLLYGFIRPDKYKWLFVSTIYSCSIPMGVLLWSLYSLVGNIGQEEIFTPSSIRKLRIISWMCFLMACFCLCAVSYHIFWFIIALCLIFMGLLIRVIKNVFVRAKEIKEENDYTI